MKPSAQRQIYIRNAKGQVWGPLGLDSISMLVGNGLLHGELQVSKDGANFASPSHFPDVRDFFPKELWGPMPAAPTAKPASTEAVSSTSTMPAPPTAPPKAPATAPPKPPTTAPPRPPTTAPPRPPTTAPPRAPETVAESRREPPANGNLSETSPVKLYYLAASSDSTGLLTLRLTDRTIEVHFRKGNPEFVSSSHPDDSDADFLIKEGLATAEQIASAHAEKDRFGGELVGALFALGALNPTTAFAQLAERSSRLLVKALSAEEGTYSYETKELPAHKSLPIGSKWQILADIVRRMPVGELRRRLQPFIERPFMKSGGRVAVADLRLTPQEMRAYGCVDGVRSLAQLMAAAPEQSDHYLRMAFLLREVENVGFGHEASRQPDEPAKPEQKQAARPPPPKPASTAGRPKPAPKPAPTQKAPTPSRPAAAVAATAAPVDIPRAMSEARRQLESMKEKNHFQILGVSETADSNTIKAAYFKLAKGHHPDTVPSEAPPEFAELKSTIFGLINQAYQVLSNPNERASYVEQLRTGVTGEVDVAQIFAAEELFQRGCAMVKMRKYEESINTFNEAIKANGEEGEFYAWRGYAKFFTYSDKKQGVSEANKDIQTALKKNERCAQAYYFLGYFARVLGDNFGATKQFQQALAIAPHHLDAQRELRLVNSKK